MLMSVCPDQSTAAASVHDAAQRAARLIPPLWPLATSVAVNPYLGHVDETLAMTSVRLRRAAGVRSTMPRRWYAERMRAGEISDADLAAAWKAAPTIPAIETLAQLKASASMDSRTLGAHPTVAALASAASGSDWPGIVAARISHWAAGYFDQGQALWSAPRGRNAYEAWRAFASLDLTPEIAGLKGFASQVSRLPETAEKAIAAGVADLGLGDAALESYFHRLLASLGGWSQMARYRQWQAELAGGSDRTVTDLLAIRLAWEVALWRQHAAAIEPDWHAAISAYAEPLAPTRDDLIDAVLQEAFERAGQRQLAVELSRDIAVSSPGRAPLQMAFCIDVRSEVFRRALERVDPRIQTLGMAGFFGIGVAHRRFASDVAEARLPALLHPQWRSCAGAADDHTAQRDRDRRIDHRATRAWGRFKLAAISSFAFVEATGPLYIGKLLRDGLGFGHARKPGEPMPRIESAPDLEARVAAAAGALRAMSLTRNFARLVVLAGHGAEVVNNPHGSGLDCGACGGHAGDVNARLMAGLLNDPDVRAGLASRGIAIPADTLFVGALHVSTTDTVVLYDTDHPSSAHAADLAQANCWMAAAGRFARSERMLRLPGAARGEDVFRRASDWSEVRPEWALAGCQSFIVAPRRRTATRDLGGRAFLQEYEWQQDEGFGVLEMILTAPVVVASWISLQYYGSSVAPTLFGAGNKLLHNVTGGIGVVEGNGGLLRAGLPWQSVHDGERLMHQPRRLSVLVDAPREAISAILERHGNLRSLFEHRWMHLFALDERGRMAWRYAGDRCWQSMSDAEARLATADVALA
ncbi:YbcC family protein [Rhodanobacter spathiphylli]|uniref:Probable inorganic carbon transporter subunit DabA n=1 Tax=Rhodanobacter spathiphylli B39 TaxID=1163407 RepID=I4W5N0_9GAMM|nr:DUF2309 domain-containing protein [Rhodanobacter spathiphylli]EIL94771.1 hypothetical protein UU7_01382 [Rhodanobacter spathiphylli B39]